MSEPAVVPATARDRRAVVGTITAAFVSDPAFRFFFPDDATYPELVQTFAGYLFDKRLVTAGAWVVDGGAAVALWDRPAGGRAEGDASVDSEAVPELRLPDDVQARLDSWDSAVHHFLPSDPHWYLGVLATDPAQAGRGLGRAAMSVGLAQAVRDGFPAYLETATQANVDLYRRSGWDVVQTAVVGPVTVRVMRHPGGQT